LAWFNKGAAPNNVAHARGFFERALNADPENVDALVGLGYLDSVEGANSFVTDPMAAFAAAEAKLTKGLSFAPSHARAHMFLGFVYVLTRRADQGIAECERALSLDRNLANAHAYVGLGKAFNGRTEDTEAHIAAALRLSPFDTMAYVWMSFAGISKNQPGSYEQAILWFRRSIEANRNCPSSHFQLAAALANVGKLEEARLATEAGLALNPAASISRFRAIYSTASDNPTYLTLLTSLVEGMRKAGVPEQ